MNNETVDKIMEIVYCRSTLVHPADCGDCNCRDKISAILAEPQVIVVDGVEWEATCFVNGKNIVAKDSRGNWIYFSGSDSGYKSTAISALTAATAAIKEEKSEPVTWKNACNHAGCRANSGKVNDSYCRVHQKLIKEWESKIKAGKGGEDDKG